VTRAEPRVLFVIHQIGSGADGGIRSIGEMIRAVPELDKRVVTNIESTITAGLRELAPVEIWDMEEPAYIRGDSRLFYRVAQIRARLVNNWRAWQAVRRIKANVLHANDLRAFWNTALGARLAGARVILNVRDTMRDGGNIRQWRASLRLCDCFLVLSKEMLMAWRRDLAPLSEQPEHRAKFAFLYSIVDPKSYYPVDPVTRSALRGELGVEEGRPVLVYVGRFDEKKAQLALIENGLPAIVGARPDAIVYFVGDFDPATDRYAAACAAAVREQGLEGAVRFIGYSSRTADWYRAADLVFLASQREGLARCMIESLACGIPVVSFGVCSAYEMLVDHECGVAVQCGDYIGLADACAELLGNELLRARLGANGPPLAARLFEPTANGASYRRLLEHLLARDRVASNFGE
jgi:glycosyltransferase involved in cell wall biosynthesis